MRIGRKVGEKELRGGPSGREGARMFDGLSLGGCRLEVRVLCATELSCVGRGRERKVEGSGGDYVIFDIEKNPGGGELTIINDNKLIDHEISCRMR